MVKRKPVTPDLMIQLRPGSHESGSVDISNLYSFLPGKRIYKAHYLAFVRVQGGNPAMLTVQSPQASFVFHR